LISILDHPVMIRELKNLERRPSPGGKDKVDHPKGLHDDYSNALSLAAVTAAMKPASQVSLSAVTKEFVERRS